ncbi:MAG: cytochrome C, partial [Planctomycetes bacterium]|nr:cytochrome C [Planctomycetota bacterium]
MSKIAGSNRRLLPILLALAVSFTIGLASGRTDDSARVRRQPQRTAKKEKLKQDYSAELPRIAPQSPQQALKSFRLRPGFRIELVAAEPLIRDPVAIDFDENGRLYVCEMPEYNQYANKNFKGQGSVRLLEDTNGDGRFDKSTLFLEKISAPTSVFCYDGGVFIGSVPDLLFCKDTNGDGKADVREIVFTGFARDKAGEAMLNSFRWGLDNRVHLSTNLAGGSVKASTNRKAKPVSVRGRGFLFDPRTRKFELTSGGGQHGMSMDDWGRKFVCSNSNPAQLLMYDGRYLSRNPFMSAPAAAVNIAPGGKHTKIYRISRIEPWRILRTRLRSKGLVRGPVEGGKPSGFFTGATGVTIYRGSAFPNSFRGDLFVGEVASNIIYRAKLEPNGLSLTARRAEDKVEFLASTDNWFRPVQFAHAPDGALYVVDMYRELIEGAAFLPPQILKHLDVASGVNRGRIYRIVPDGFRQPKPPRLGKAKTAELVRLLEHRNSWHRNTAARLLYQRQDKTVVGNIKRLVINSRFPQGRVHALYALDGMNALDADLLAQALKDRNSNVRIHALRLSERFLADDLRLRLALRTMVNDPHLRVRYQLAFSLGALKPGTPMRNELLLLLLHHDGKNPWFRLAIQSSLGDGAGEFFERAMRDQQLRAGKMRSVKIRRTKHGAEFLQKLARQIGAAKKKNEAAALYRAIGNLPKDESVLAQRLIRSYATGLPAAERKRFLAGGSERTRKLMAALLTTAKKTAADSRAKVTDRVIAVRTLGLTEFDGVRRLFRQLMQLQQPQAVQAAVLETCGRFDDPQVAAFLLDVWSGLSPRLRSRAAETLFSRTKWISAFFDA